MYFIHSGESLTSALLLASFLIVLLVQVRLVKMDRLHGFRAHFYVWRHKSLWWMVKHLVSVNTLWQTARKFTILGIFGYIQESVWWHCFLETMWSKVSNIHKDLW
jgi:hypothetical protein